MKEWFKAWKNQDDSERAYKDHFKPVLCYMEGAWLEEDTADLDGFTSFRHFVNAADWDNLHERIMFTSYNGRKDNFENLSHLPKKIMGITNGVPDIAQWNYRILCHPLKNDLPLRNLQLVDDLSRRVAENLKLKEYELSKTARYNIDPKHLKLADSERNLLDELMEEIPGANNYPASNTDDTFDTLAKDKTGDALNSGFYHRWMKVNGENVKRNYADQNLFMAQTKNTEVAGMKMEVCDHGKTPEDHVGTPGNLTNCKSFEQRWTYAIPIEIVYMTPLPNWNPLNLPYKGDHDSQSAQAVTADDRDGTPDKAFNGTHEMLLYQTPAAMFADDEYHHVPADTTLNTVSVMDSNGHVEQSRGSGHRMFLPKITGLGVVRQRYPIFPVFTDETPESKEINAIKELLMDPAKLRKFRIKQ